MNKDHLDTLVLPDNNTHANFVNAMRHVTREVLNQHKYVDSIHAPLRTKLIESGKIIRVLEFSDVTEFQQVVDISPDLLDDAVKVMHTVYPHTHNAWGVQ